MKVKIGIIFFVLLTSMVGLLTISDKGAKVTNMETNFVSISEVSKNSWQKLAQKKIYFAHQSVGFNIMAGIESLIKKNAYLSSLRVFVSKDPAALNQPVFAHDTTGQNFSPKSKVDDFAKTMNSGIGNKADIAFVKWCYVDITKDSDIMDLFAYYSENLAKLKSTYPRTKFVHITVPLTVPMQDSPLKKIAKTILGKRINTHEDNIARNKYNDLLRKAYRGKEPLFDLARYESALKNDRIQQIIKVEGIDYEAMAYPYSDDGGHLNTLGRETMGEQLLVFLAKL